MPLHVERNVGAQQMNNCRKGHCARKVNIRVRNMGADEVDPDPLRLGGQQGPLPQPVKSFPAAAHRGTIKGGLPVLTGRWRDYLPLHGPALEKQVDGAARVARREWAHLEKSETRHVAFATFDSDDPRRQDAILPHPSLWRRGRSPHHSSFIIPLPPASSLRSSAPSASSVFMPFCL
ncbi:MAG: hypothetical protein ACF8R7_15070 [Phycisphaerales bacterium JB039]